MKSLGAAGIHVAFRGICAMLKVSSGHGEAWLR